MPIQFKSMVDFREKKKALDETSQNWIRLAFALIIFLVIAIPVVVAGENKNYPTQYKSVDIDGLNIFYREAGPQDAPTILLLHGFPTSSHMYRNLIPELSNHYHVLAPDYPGYGNSAMPTVDEFEYSFDRLAEIVDQFTVKLEIDRFSLYVMDYGAPVGFRIAAKYPQRIESIIIQNGNAYEEGLREFWEPLKSYWKDRNPETTKPLRDLLTISATKWQYTNGTRNAEAISPDNWVVDQALLDRPGNVDIQLQLFFDYGSNPPLYPHWQEYFREHQPPALIIWGKNDVIFPAEGAYPYQRDLTNIEFHLLDTGHFLLEEDLDTVAPIIRKFLEKNVEKFKTPL